MTEQERHLQIVKGLAALLACALVVVAWLVYYGHELPFYDMRRQHTDSTGYAAPVRGSDVQTGAVPAAVGLQPGPAPLTPPGAAAGLRNPLAGDRRAADKGRGLYDVNCAQCHGAGGRGDGAVGVSYVPRPTDLLGARVRGLTDGALFGSITDGIVSTPLPTTRRYLPRDWHAYRAVTTVEERWQMVAYVRRLEGKRATP